MFDQHTRRLKPLNAMMLMLGAVDTGNHHPRHPGPDQRVGTGRRAPMPAARFQGDVGGGAPRIGARLAQGIDFGVCLPRPLVPALAKQQVALGDHATDPRVRRRGKGAAVSQFQGEPHEVHVARQRQAHVRTSANRYTASPCWRSITTRSCQVKPNASRVSRTPCSVKK